MKTKKELEPCICGSFDHKKHPTVTPENQHTPTPWRATNWGQTITIRSKECDGIAFLNPNGDSNKGIPTAFESANAAFIVRAVNSFEAMLGELKGCLDRDSYVPGGCLDSIQRVRIRQVINRAEGNS
jgi:hypothetical protein